MSVLLHTVVLVGVVAGTGQSDPAPVIPELLNKLIYTPPKPIAPSTLTTDHHSLVFGVESTGLPPIPADIDPVDPVIDLGSIPLAPATPEEGFLRTAMSGEAAAPSTHVEGIPYDATAVDRAVVPRSGNPTPRYPQFLASMGMEGSVVARFVVDTLGRVEVQSIVIVNSTQAQFERAVRDAIPGMRFSPAEVRGIRVRQLVEQSFGFELNH